MGANVNLKRIFLPGLIALSSFSFGIGEFAVSTDYFQYSGTVTKYSTLGDALAETNSTGAGTFQTRDGSFYQGKSAPTSYLGTGWENSNVFLTAWWYTTDSAHGEYSGWGNPNNANDSFLQLYDQSAASRSSASGSWSAGGYSTLNVSVSGSNAGAESFARLWPTNDNGGGGQGGVFLNYDLNYSVSGLNGVLDPTTGFYVDTTNRGHVTGSFIGIFQNTSTSVPANNGYFKFNLTLSDSGTSYAEQNAGSLNGALSPTLFAAVPEPASMIAMGVGLSALLARRRRKA